MKQTKQFMQHLLLMLVALMSAASAKAANYDFKAENSDGVTIYYKVNGDNATVVAGDEKYTGSVNIPEMVTNEGKEYAVTTIGERAFYECKFLTEIVIPQSITTIKGYAFGDCVLLSSIIFPNSVKSLEVGVCQNCSNLASVQLPNSIKTVPEWAFFNTLLKAVDIPNSVDEIGESAFNNCQLETIEIPSSVRIISSDAFSHNNKMIKIVIPNSVISIGSQAFNWSTNIKEVIAKIETPFTISDVFGYGTKRNAILYVPVGTKELYQSTDGWDFDNIVEEQEDAPQRFSAQNSDGVTIYYAVDGDNVTVVKGGTEYRGSVVIPETVTYNQKKYTVRAIDKDAFQQSRHLTFVSIPNTVTALSEWGFNACSELETVKLSESITELPENVFRNSGLISLTIPKGVKVIAGDAFYNCRNLVSLDMPNTLQEIKSQAFAGCRSLEIITLPNSLETIDNHAFTSAGIKEVRSYIQLPFDIGFAFSNEIKEEATLYVPIGTKGLYETTRGWNFANIIEMEPEKQSQVITLTANLQTFCSAKSLDFTGVEGLKAYIASGFSPSTGEVIMSSVNIVPAKTGLLLLGMAGQEYKVPFAETDFIYSNLFRGLIEDVEVTSGYVLSGNEFVAVDDVVTVKGGEAYLNVTPAANAPRLAIRFTDTTDLSDIAGVSAVLYDEVEASDAWYTLQGVRLKEKPSKTGIYLHGGRKVIVK